MPFVLRVSRATEFIIAYQNNLNVFNLIIYPNPSSFCTRACVIKQDSTCYINGGHKCHTAWCNNLTD